MKSLNQLQYPAVNVVAGMRLNTVHFQQIFDWILALNADGLNVLLRDHSFGLISMSRQETSPNFDLAIEGEELLLKKFAVVFPNGMITAGIEEVTPVIKSSLRELKSGDYDIVLTVEPGQSNAIGEPDPGEIPLRHPFCLPLCRLNILPEGELNFHEIQNGIKIASLSYQNDVFTFADNYIPPSVHLGGYRKLWETYASYNQKWKYFCDYSVNILQKTSSNDPSPVITSLRKLTEEVGKYLVQNKMAFHSLGRKGSPMEMLKYCINLASIFHFYLETLENEAELIELFKRHVKSLPGYDEFKRQGFRDAVKTATNLECDALEIGRALETLNIFFDEVLTAWKRLSEATQLLYVPTNSSKMFIR